MKLKLVITSEERTAIVAALMAYGWPDLAVSLSGRVKNVADDGPEIDILRILRSK
jgi:hypothetical protein